VLKNRGLRHQLPGLSIPPNFREDIPYEVLIIPTGQPGSKTSHVEVKKHGIYSKAGGLLSSRLFSPFVVSSRNAAEGVDTEHCR
jgi:hypothetical protein